jgi:hypothetical protein
MPDYRKNPNPTRSTGGLPAVTPMEVDRVRRSVLDIVRKNIPNVREVLEGKKSWSNQQVRLFGMVLNKVMPDLHHSFNEHSVELKEAHELSIEELEAIALRANAAEAEDIPYTDAPDPSDPTDDSSIDDALSQNSEADQ